MNNYDQNSNYCCYAEEQETQEMTVIFDLVFDFYPSLSPSLISPTSLPYDKQLSILCVYEYLLFKNTLQYLFSPFIYPIGIS